jgi:hypothetical protein
MIMVHLIFRFKICNKCWKLSDWEFFFWGRGIQLNACSGVRGCWQLHAFAFRLQWDLGTFYESCRFDILDKWIAFVGILIDVVCTLVSGFYYWFFLEKCKFRLIYGNFDVKFDDNFLVVLYVNISLAMFK